MNEELEISAIAQLASNLGQTLSYDGDRLIVLDTVITLPSFRRAARQADPFGDLKYALPSKAHGDAREKLLYMIVQDASPSGRPAADRLDAIFRQRMQESLPVPDALARTVLAEAIRDAYWTTPDKNSYPIPYHSRIPLAFRLSRLGPRGRWVEARYKLFSGDILPFLCWDGDQVDRQPITALFHVLSSEDGFSIVDKLTLEAAREASPDRPDAASVDTIVGQLDSDIIDELRAGAFCPPAMAQFRRDLLSILRLSDRLPRRDLINMVTLLLSLHLATYYYRIAHVLGAEVDDVITAVNDPASAQPASGLCNCNCPLEKCSLASRIKFRVGTGGDRPVSRQDGCAIAFRELDARRLQPLAATIATANILQLIWSAMGGPAGRPRLRELAGLLRSNSAFRVRFDLAAASAACLLACQTSITASEAARLASKRPGVFALREATLDSRRSDLKYRGRDVVNQLVKREATGGILIRTRGNVQFFEVDEDMLFVLVAIICEDREIPYTELLSGLLRYGLAPQDAAERLRLADALERLGMLRRYSDAGESTYVRYAE